MTDKEFEQIKNEIFGESVKKPAPKPDPRFTERSDNPTPCGGDYSIAYYYDEEGFPCEKINANFVNIVEYAADGTRINEHYGMMGKVSNHKL